eukprot:1159179-Pelagomonas_calceolata.AAC.7
MQAVDVWVATCRRPGMAADLQPGTSCHPYRLRSWVSATWHGRCGACYPRGWVRCIPGVQCLRAHTAISKGRC